MKTVKWLIALLFIGVAAYFIVQELEKQAMEESISQQPSDYKMSYYKDGSVKAKVKIVDGKREGKGYNYYNNGTVHSEINYENGIKQGNSTWFFENGKPYRITPYLNNRKHGIQKKYYETGELLAEVPYKNGELQVGTKEYLKSGKLITDYPVIVVKGWDNTLLRSTYDIDLKLTEDNRVDFRVFDTKTNIEYFIKPTSSGYQRVSFFSAPGNLELKEILIVAKFRTNHGNYKLITKRHKFATGQE